MTRIVALGGTVRPGWSIELAPAVACYRAKPPAWKTPLGAMQLSR